MSGSISCSSRNCGGEAYTAILPVPPCRRGGQETDSVSLAFCDVLEKETKGNVSGDAHMEYTILGRSGLQVSIAGLGCGGPSRLGQAIGKSEQESIAVVRQAVDLGITLFDTAEVYGTEAIVGKALETIPRDKVVIAIKKLPPSPNHPDPVGELKQGLEYSLRRLRTDYVDIYFLHGVLLEQYRYAYDILAPVLLRLREEGKIRTVGITEAFSVDQRHQMLQQALEADCWDVMMVGFNLLNPSARSRVFTKTLEKNIGVLCM